MLNIGMTELLVFGIIALLVLGPDKLPEAARFAAKWYGKAKKMINNIQNEIDQSLKLSEFRAEMQKEIDRISEIEQRIQQQIDSLNQTQLKKNPNTESSASTLRVAAIQLNQLHYDWLEPNMHPAVPFKPYFMLKHPPLKSAEPLTAPVELKIAV